MGGWAGGQRCSATYSRRCWLSHCMEGGLSLCMEGGLSLCMEGGLSLSLSLSGVQEHCKLNNNYDNEHTNIIEH